MTHCKHPASAEGAGRASAGEATATKWLTIHRQKNSQKDDGRSSATLFAS
jgi:hypothetical protein